MLVKGIFGTYLNVCFVQTEYETKGQILKCNAEHGSTET